MCYPCFILTFYDTEEGLQDVQLFLHEYTAAAAAAAAAAAKDGSPISGPSILISSSLFCPV